MTSQHDSAIGPIIVMGVSGSGKSLIGTGLAEALALPFIEGDKLHPRSNVEKMSAGIALSDEDRWPWLDRIGEELCALTSEHGGAVAACSALKRIYRERLRDKAGSSLRFVFLDGSHELLEERMRARKHHFMPATLLDSQLATLEKPGGETGVFTLDIDAEPKTIVAAAADRLLGRIRKT